MPSMIEDAYRQQMMAQQQQQMQQALQQQNGQQMPQQQQIDPLQGMNQQMQQARNPLATGAGNAIEQAKRSLQMSDDESRRSFGRALISFASAAARNPAPVGSGFAGTLGSINAGFEPALNAYDAEQERIRAHKMQLMAVEAERRKEEREMARQAHEMKMHEANLKINQGYLTLKQQEEEQARLQAEQERLEAEKLLKPGAMIPLASLKGSSWNLVQNTLNEYTKEADAAAHGLSDITEAEKILHEDPNITKYASTIMLAAQRSDPNIIKQKLNSFYVSDADRFNAERLAKHLSNIYTSKLKGFSPKGMNMFMEKQLREGSVDMNMDAKSILKLLSQDKKSLAHVYDSRAEALQKASEGYFKRVAPLKFEGHDDEEQQAQAQPMQMSDDDRQARIRQLKEEKLRLLKSGR